MAKVDRRAPSGIPAKDGGNRKTPASAGKFPTPPNFKTTYGVGDGAGGGGVQAKDGGNRKNPSSAGKFPLPPNYDSYNQSSK